MTRRILLPLAADTTDTECGACAMLARKSPGMGYAPVMRCVLFRADSTVDVQAFAYDERLPRPADCLTAEREAVALRERAERAERERDARPEISVGDATTFTIWRHDLVRPDVRQCVNRIELALRAHAKKTREPSR